MHQDYGGRRSRAFPRRESEEQAHLLSTDEDNTSTYDTDDQSSVASTSSGSGRHGSRQKATKADDYDEDGYARRRTGPRKPRRVSMTLVWIVVGAALLVLAAIGSFGYMMLGDGRLSEEEALDSTSGDKQTTAVGDQDSSLTDAETQVRSLRPSSSKVFGTPVGTSSAKDGRPTSTGGESTAADSDSEKGNSNRPSATEEQARPTDSKPSEETLNVTIGWLIS